MAAGAVLTPLFLSGCGSNGGASATSAGTATADSSDSSAGGALSGQKLTFVGDDAFAPYRYIDETGGSQKVVGLDIAVADEMAKRLGFTYEFEAQKFAATLASVQGNDKDFTMAMSSNEEREKTYDFTRGYYQPLVGVLTQGDKVTSVDGLKGKSIACTTGTVQNKFVTSVLPDADVHTYDDGNQCLQEVLAGRIDAYVCDGAEGVSMQKANDKLTLGLLDRSETSDYVGVYRVMAVKGASFISAFDECIGQMLEDGTIDKFIGKYVGKDFEWGDDTSAAGSSTVGDAADSSAQ
ncbi:MAG: ABC transporter substrate-binding protein [Olsenella sp.]|nr:ABC transporter substrate-binding protein [Olsenella sp.]